MIKEKTSHVDTKGSAFQQTQQQINAKALRLDCVLAIFEEQEEFRVAEVE